MNKLNKFNTKLFNKVKKQTMLGFFPHEGQKRVLNSLMNAYVNKTPRKHVLDISRQWGKTIMVQNLFSWITINNPNQECVYISPTFKLAKRVFREFVNAIEGAPCIKPNGINKTEMIVQFTNGSSCKFGSGDKNPNAWRGGTYDVVCIDEAAFCDEKLWNVIEPTLNVKRGLAILVSTPNGRNWFFNMYNRGLNGDPDYKSYTAPSSESPYINKKEIEEIKKHNINQWRVEYNAEFLEDELSVFRNVDLNSVIDLNTTRKENEVFYLGYDLGRRRDYTVGICIDSNYHVRDIFRTNKKEWDQIIPEMVDFYKKWEPRLGYVENNYNDRVIDELVNQHGCRNLQGKNSNVSSKPQMVDNVQILLDSNTLKLPIPVDGRTTKILNTELKQYQKKYNPRTRNESFSAPGDLHDDTVSALLMATAALFEKQPKKSKMIWEKF